MEDTREINRLLHANLEQKPTDPRLTVEPQMLNESLDPKTFLKWPNMTDPKLIFDPSRCGSCGRHYRDNKPQCQCQDLVTLFILSLIILAFGVLAATIAASVWIGSLRQ